MPDETLTLDQPAAAPVDKSAERVRQMFAEIAPRYDFLNHVLSAGTDYYWRWMTVRKAPPRGPAPVLDVCTGTGDLAIAYWKRGRGQTPVVGADFCYPMLVRGLAKAIRAGAANATDKIATGSSAAAGAANDDHRAGPELGGDTPGDGAMGEDSPVDGAMGEDSPVDRVMGEDSPVDRAAGGDSPVDGAAGGFSPGVTFVEADAERLPFPDERFQIVSVAFGLRNVSDTRRGIAEMVRVLQPGGRLVVLEFSLPGWAPLRAAYLWYFRNVLPRIGQALGRNRQGAYNYLPDSVGQFPYGQALADMFREAGLGEVRFWPLSFGVATLYVGRK